MAVNWTREQKQVIEGREKSLLVSAATAVLVERIIQMITEGENPKDIDRLLVMTFTRAAAAEMRERIQAAIEKKLESEPENEHLQQQAVLVQFAQMGSLYMKYVMGIENPRVAIVNIGVEEEKGNALVKETYPMLKECKDINFIGSIEARDIPAGKADVVVCEAFVGNVILKLYEGVGATLIKKVKGGMMTNLRSKIGALLVKPALKQTLKAFDLEEYGGAPLLGLKGLVVKTHGSSKSVEIKNTILQCITFQEQDVVGKITASIAAAKEEG